MVFLHAKFISVMKTVQKPTVLFEIFTETLEQIVHENSKIIENH